jgi:hypothetical protein
MTVENLIAVFTVLFTIALAVERLIQIAKPLLEKIKDPLWLESAKVASAVVVGFGLAALFRFDLLERMTVTGTLPVIGYALAGLVASVGSSTLHAILEWLKTLRGSDNVVTTEKFERSISTPPVQPVELKVETGEQ